MLAAELPKINPENYPAGRRSLEAAYNRVNAFEWGYWLYAFSLLFLLPVLIFWLLIVARQGAGWKAVDVVLFLLGGLVFYGLFYFFGFITYDYNFAFAWFMLMMFSIRMIGFWTAAVITAIVAAGLSLVVEPASIKT